MPTLMPIWFKMGHCGSRRHLFQFATRAPLQTPPLRRPAEDIARLTFLHQLFRVAHLDQATRVAGPLAPRSASLEDEQMHLFRRVVFSCSPIYVHRRVFKATGRH